MTPVGFDLELARGVSVVARLFGAPDLPGVPVLIGPAMGVPAKFYDSLARDLAHRGHPVLVADLRGIGGSNLRAKQGADFGYADLVANDYPVLVAELKKRCGRTPILFGHSLGGQLGCVFAGQDPDALAGIALIASCSVYYRCWPRRARPGLWAFYHFARATSARLGYWPGPRFRFGGYEAKTVVADWAHQGLTGRYQPAGMNADTDTAMARAVCPVLAINLSDDSWAPMRATDHLLDKLPNAPTTRILLQPAELSLDTVGHFGWRRRSGKIADLVHSWILDNDLQ